MPSWSRHFDRIWCFHYLKDADRLPGMEAELRRVGILDSGVFSFRHTSPDPWERKLAKVCPAVSGHHGAKIGFLNLGLATARALREAVALGYRRVLFLEDDIRFLRDVGEIAATLDTMPDGFDVVQLEHFVFHKQIPDKAAYDNACETRSLNGRFFRADGLTLWSGGCVSLNASAMERLLPMMERRPQPLDGLIQSAEVGPRAATKRNIAVQVALGDAMMWQYGAWEKGNQHHVSYRPQGIRYEDYAVPSGYGYESLFCKMEDGVYKAYQKGEVAPPPKPKTDADWRREFMERHKGETFANHAQMMRMMEAERDAVESGSIVQMRDRWTRRALKELVESTGANGIRMVEVGSYAGESAAVFASMPQVAELWCVDLWKGGYDQKDEASGSDFAKVEAAFDAVAARWPGKIRKFKGTLQEFHVAHPDAKPDLVYIDAEHTREACARDIATARGMEPRWIAGHDYNRESWSGVVEAVNEAFGAPDRTFGDTSWIKALTPRA